MLSFLNMLIDKIDTLTYLEAESINILRELASDCEKPVLLFSAGKDSIVVLHLALKAFAPAKLPFPLMHIDTGHNFPEAIEFRDKIVKEYDLKLLVASVQKSIEDGRVEEETGPYASRNRLQTVTLLDAIKEHQFDVAIGGARRDEERARAKERIFSHRDVFGQWDPKNQRPELWSIYNGRHRKGEHFRVFPLSNWTEMDVWQYIQRENIKIPDLYYAKKRKVFERNGMLLTPSSFIERLPGEDIFERMVRYRTVGDMSCTSAIPSNADNIEKVIDEIIATRTSERGQSRADDRTSEAAMEDRKREGYF
jgi:sulfate adenylyltransferase subunit 2